MNLSKPNNPPSRVVIKVGSSLLVDGAGKLRVAWLHSLAEDIAGLVRRGAQLLVVSSGSVALGSELLGLDRSQLKLEGRQAAAAAGQISLAGAWQEALGASGLRAAQILLTPDDTEHRRRYLNARDTIETLLGLGAVPVVNENDTIATQELRFGDNDRLSARVAVMMSADELLLLSDVDGLYTANPRQSSVATHLPVVTSITDEVRAMAGGVGTSLGSGGMTTKIMAAEIATRAGCRVVICDGRVHHPVSALSSKDTRKTIFKASQKPRNARKDWIGGHLRPTGQVIIDKGAVRALMSGRSLLPAGMISACGTFERGDAVRILDVDNREIGRGLVAYDQSEAEKLCGRQSDDVTSILGYAGREEIIHRDDLVVTLNQLQESRIDDNTPV